jgi:tetratricopeptide (TPR) repeat protein
MYNIGLSYFEGERFKQAIESFSQLIKRYKTSKLSMMSYLKMSDSYVKLKQFDKALSKLDDLLKITQDLGVKDEALYRQGWAYIETDQWEKAQGSFERISPENRGVFRLKQLSEAINKKESLKRKNPTTAGLLAVIPGAGHLYCERYRDALIAFLLNGVTIYAAYEAFDNDNPGLGSLLTFFGIGLYAGNIYSAVSSAHKYNQKQERDFLQFLKSHSILEVSAARSDHDVQLALLYKITF